MGKSINGLVNELLEAEITALNDLNKQVKKVYAILVRFANNGLDLFIGAVLYTAHAKSQNTEAF